MALSRKVLKSKFRNGSRPSQEEFEDLIDSSINSEDDGITFSETSINLSKPEASTNTDPNYKIKFGGEGIRALQFYNSEDNSRTPLLEIGENGLSTSAIDTKGLVSMQARRGSFVQADVLKPPVKSAKEAKTDDPWQTILSTQKHCQAYEIVARLEGNYPSLLVAFAVTSWSANTDKNTEKRTWLDDIVITVCSAFKKLFGISNTKICVTQAYTKWIENRIRIRWLEDYNSYSLQVKVSSGKVHYFITKLWGDDFVD